MFKSIKERLAPAFNIWCGRNQDVYFLISRVKDHGVHWYIVLFGYEIWTGSNRPTFLNKHKPGYKIGKGKR